MKVLYGASPSDSYSALEYYGSVYMGPTEYLVGRIYGHLGVPFTRGRLTDFKLGHFGVQIFGRLGKRLSWNVAGQVRERPRVNGFGQPNICKVQQRGCQYAIKKL